MCFTISAGESKDLRHGLFLAADALGKPVQVDGINVILKLDHNTCVSGEQIPAQYLMIITTRVKFIRRGPAYTTHKISVCASVKAHERWHSFIQYKRKMFNKLRYFKPFSDI